MPLLSVVIPVYKAEKSLDELYRRLRNALETISPDFEIVLVEDCGGDRSWAMIAALSATDPRVKGIKFSRNFGQHYGITAGLDHADGDWVVVMDCDLQDRPEEIPRLYQKALEGHDVVVARRGQRSDPWLKRTTSKLFYKVFNYLSGINYDAEVGNFRIISKKVVLNVRSMREKLRFFGGMVSWLGFSVASLDVQHEARFEGQSTYTFRKLFTLATDTIIAYSDKPLRLAIQVGFLISTTAFMYGIYVVLKALILGTAIAGWSSLIASMYFLSGIIISILGVIGIYLGKVFDEVKKRPLYVIEHKTFD
jgi:polyisoprenyl-phosphate glycosyltransferase